MERIPKILHTPAKNIKDTYMWSGIEWPAICTLEVFSLVYHEGKKQNDGTWTTSFNITHQVINLN